MKRAMLIGAVLVWAVSGCTTMQVNPLSHELKYQLTPAPAMEKFVDKSIAVVPFDDARMYDGANKTTSTSTAWNIVPFVVYTTGVVSHPEVSYNTSVSGMGSYVKAAGTMADAIPKLLAEYLHRSRRFSKAVFVEAAEVRDHHPYDMVLRGTLVESKLTATRFSYGLGPAAPVAYLFGAPVVKYSASLTVDWQLYDARGDKIGPKKTATLEGPVVQHTGLYYGLVRDHKDVPFGLYVDAVRTVNTKIAEEISEQIAD